MRRRRRRSAFAKPSLLEILPGAPIWGIGVGAVLIIGIFAFLIHQADTHPPEKSEMRIEMSDAFSQTTPGE